MVVLRAGHFQEPPGNCNHLDRVERGDRPLQGLGFSDRIARHQFFAFSGETQQPGAALEYFKSAIAQEWNLTERLARQMVGLSAVERDCSYGISKPSFLARPSQSHVAYKATGTFGHPIVGPDDQFVHTVAHSANLDPMT